MSQLWLTIFLSMGSLINHQIFLDTVKSLLVINVFTTNQTIFVLEDLVLSINLK